MEQLMDELLNIFPENDYPELFDLYLEWDDTIRLILDYCPADKQYNQTINLIDRFQDIFSNGVRIRYYQNIPDKNIINEWNQKYEELIIVFFKELEETREDILSENYESSGEDEVTVQKLMKYAYESHRESFQESHIIDREVS